MKLIYGLPMSGKSTLAKVLICICEQHHISMNVIDTDDLILKNGWDNHSIDTKYKVLNYLKNQRNYFDVIFTNFQFNEGEIKQLLSEKDDQFLLLPLPTKTRFIKEWEKCRDIPLQLGLDWYTGAAHYIKEMKMQYKIITLEDVIITFNQLLTPDS